MSKLAQIRFKLKPAAIMLPHWLTVGLVTLGTAFVGGFLQYLQAIPMAQWLSGLSDPKTLLNLVVAAVVAGAAALVAQLLLLLKQWIATAPPPVPTNAVPPPEQT